MNEPKPPDSGNSGDVLSSLPSARPQRRSPKRDGGTRSKRDGGTRAKAGAGATAAKAGDGATRPAARKRAARHTSATTLPAAAGARAGATKAAKPIAAQGYQTVDSTPVEPPSSTEILISAVQAAGEVAQIGITLGERLLRAATSRLPRP